jgi:hypothetical protein
MHFRRPLPATRIERRPHELRAGAASVPSRSNVVATKLLFDRDPRQVVAQVRAWLAEDDLV